MDVSWLLQQFLSVNHIFCENWQKIKAAFCYFPWMPNFIKLKRWQSVNYSMQNISLYAFSVFLLNVVRFHLLSAAVQYCKGWFINTSLWLWLIVIVIFTYYSNPPKPHFSTRVPILSLSCREIVARIVGGLAAPHLAKQSACIALYYRHTAVRTAYI